MKPTSIVVVSIFLAVSSTGVSHLAKKQIKDKNFLEQQPASGDISPYPGITNKPVPGIEYRELDTHPTNAIPGAPRNGVRVIGPEVEQLIYKADFRQYCIQFKERMRNYRQSQVNVVIELGVASPAPVPKTRLSTGEKAMADIAASCSVVLAEFEQEFHKLFEDRHIDYAVLRELLPDKFPLPENQTGTIEPNSDDTWYDSLLFWSTKAIEVVVFYVVYDSVISQFIRRGRAG